jgi:hypothetical protein
MANTNYTLDPMVVEVAPSQYTLPPMQFQVQERQNVQLPPMSVPRTASTGIDNLLQMQRAKKAQQEELYKRLQAGMHYVDEGAMIPGPNMIPWGAVKDNWPFPVAQGRTPVGITVSPSDLKMMRDMQAREIAMKESAGIK